MPLPPDPNALAAAAPAPHLFWNAESLWRVLETYLPGVSVEVVARAESTNTLLLERARTGSGRRDAPVTTPGELEALRQQGAALTEAAGPHGRRADDTQPCLLVAEHQTLGRGRQGRSWVSAPGASLTFSLMLPMAPRDWWGLSLAAGLALADALDPPEPGRPPRVGLKWPNDLWLLDGPLSSGRGRKLCGVLIETVAVGARRMVVIGVGLNVAPLPPGSSPRELIEAYASLRELDAAASAPAALHRVAVPLVRALQQFEREGFAGFADAYARRDVLRGQRVVVLDTLRGEPHAEGLCEGLAANGALLIRDAQGQTRPVTSGEVSVRLDGRPAGS